MQAQGIKSLFPMEELSIMGVLGIVKDLPNLFRRLRETVEAIKKLNPDVVLTIDAPEFSFRVMKRLYKLPHRPRLIHYVAPTVWAWRPSRAKKISCFLDHLLCLYPFEPPLFEKWGLRSTFVGHPVASEKREEGRRDPHLLCVLPGSRASEIKTLMPLFGKTVGLLQKNHPELKVVIPTLPNVEALVREGLKAWPFMPQIVVGKEARNRVFETAHVALAASGTVTLELAAAGLPFLVAYKIGPLSGWIARRLILTPWVCMVNIVLNFRDRPMNPVSYSQSISSGQAGDREVSPMSVVTYVTEGESRRGANPDLDRQRVHIPELIQQDCRPEKLAAALEPLMKSGSVRRNQHVAMTEGIRLLKTPSADLAAKIILAEL